MFNLAISHHVRNLPTNLCAISRGFSTCKWSLATQLARGPKVPSETHAPTSMPIFQTATFDCLDQAHYDYTRSGNPTRHAFEDICSQIEGGHRSFAFTSGMAALTAVTRLLGPGDSVVASKDIYGGMHRLLRFCVARSGIRVKFVETWEIDKLEQALEEMPSVKLLCIETPSNPQLRVSNLRKCAQLAQANGALLCVDNSLMSPVLMKPLDLGADLVVHSATKFLSGHSDVTAGVVSVKSVDIAEQLAFVQNCEGSGLAPFDAWLILRGMKTMALRVKAAQENAVEVAKFLRAHPAVKHVNYLFPLVEGLEEKAQAEARLHFTQARGGGSVMSFEVESVAVAESIIRHVKLFKNTVSFGACGSLIEIPAKMSHASIPTDEQHLSPTLIRLSMGIEEPVDLLHDLETAIACAIAEAGGDENATNVETSGSHILGESLPPQDPHAVGVSMPQWADVVAYEEGCQEVHEKLRAGYPRFVFLKSVMRLFKKAEELFAKPGEAAMVLPSARVALRLQQFLHKNGVEHVDMHDFFAHGAFAVTFPASAANHAKAFWQHTGEIISSRFADAVLDVIERTCEENADKRVADALPAFGEADCDVHLELRERLATLCLQDKHNVFLYPTGMAALTATHRLLQLSSEWEDKPLRTIVFGFPYLDTLKLSEISTGCLFFGRGDQVDLTALEKVLQEERFGGMFCEFASNPLLISPDLSAIRVLADRYGVPVICDNTVSFPNVDVLRPGGADICITSLTKQFSGSGNVMGGALILNSRSKHYSKHRARLNRDYEELLWADDAKVLLEGSHDFCMRTAKANMSAQVLVDLLQQHPLVKAVYHPSIMTPDLYEQWRLDASYAGGGALLSVVLHTPEQCKVFYDALDVAKGPGFGTNFTLACPYTVIAHFKELEWAEKFGVDPNLVRIWIGQESTDDLVDKINSALEKVIQETST